MGYIDLRGIWHFVANKKPPEFADYFCIRQDGSKGTYGYRDITNTWTDYMDNEIVSEPPAQWLELVPHEFDAPYKKEGTE